jgi:hypothetical protein
MQGTRPWGVLRHTRLTCESQIPARCLHVPSGPAVTLELVRTLTLTLTLTSTASGTETTIRHSTRTRRRRIGRDWWV